MSHTWAMIWLSWWVWLVSLFSTKFWQPGLDVNPHMQRFQISKMLWSLKPVCKYDNRPVLSGLHEQILRFRGANQCSSIDCVHQITSCSVLFPKATETCSLLVFLVLLNLCFDTITIRKTRQVLSLLFYYMTIIENLEILWYFICCFIVLNLLWQR